MIQLMGSEAQQLKHLPKNGGGSANTNSVQLIKSGGYGQFSVPKPPQRKAANRYASLQDS